MSERLIGFLEDDDGQHIKSQLLALDHFKGELGFIGYIYGSSGSDMFRHIAKAVDEIDWIRRKLEGLLPKSRRAKRAALGGAASSRAVSPSNAGGPPAPPAADNHQTTQPPNHQTGEMP